MKKTALYLSLTLFIAFSAFGQETSATFHQDVRWSPDGRFLSFSEMQFAETNGKRTMSANVFVLDLESRKAVKVTGDDLNQYFVSWSPDSSMIAFGAADPKTQEADIYAVNRDGTGLKRLTSFPGRESAPSFSPDGERIVFASSKDTEKYQLYVMEIGSGKTERITHDDEIAHYNPEWSPDGKRIAYYSEKGDNKDQIWTIAPDGSGAVLLTGGIGHNIYPGFSADGKRIIFSSTRDDIKGGIFTMDLKGGDLKRLGEVTSSWARFSPDGKKIAYVGGRFPKSEIFIANADGSAPEKVR